MRYRRPVGWRQESYRHYLAAKGISTSKRRKYLAGEDVYKDWKDWRTQSRWRRKNDIKTGGFITVGQMREYGKEPEEREVFADASTIDIPEYSKVMSERYKKEFEEEQAQRLAKIAKNDKKRLLRDYRLASAPSEVHVFEREIGGG